MYRHSFPKCKVDGDLKPVEYGHMFSNGAIPQKCSTCSNLFEGECLRAIDATDNYLRLDYGSCEIEGSSEPVEIEKKGKNSVLVPQKCSSCNFLSHSSIHGYFCSSQNKVWGDFPRDLDWGNWQPDHPIIGLRRLESGTHSTEYSGPMIITRELVLLLMKNETTKALKLHRELNGVKAIKEAKEDIDRLLDKLKKAIEKNG